MLLREVLQRHGQRSRPLRTVRTQVRACARVLRGEVRGPSQRPKSLRCVRECLLCAGRVQLRDV
ncbi:hypothetical protein QJS04_geneDACA019733 [Acorus gramineus]|uniref:Uncharacterized protein n=1 Tax=Acorus gramineus TaxID=55184 RepID=A0AAV9BTR0_ACOGR|nr:hypothetical protein QJS04_geneDACA019733 [Acorus gramineus]